jgi:hypothetical protein
LNAAVTVTFSAPITIGEKTNAFNDDNPAGASVGFVLSAGLGRAF